MRQFLLALALAASVQAVSATPQTRNYPEHGNVVEFHANGTAHWVYQIETSKAAYLVRGGRGPEFQVKQEVDLRVQKSRVYIQMRQKEKEFQLLQTTAR
jgi:hypothetical protein